MGYKEQVEVVVMSTPDISVNFLQTNWNFIPYLITHIFNKKFKFKIKIKDKKTILMFTVYFQF